ncbi:cell wall protein [Colletotrichum higginsianum]|nr:cell wall protein [Colletotrichum higginsianum]
MHAPSFTFGLLGQAVLIAAVPLKPRPVTIESRDSLDDIEIALVPVFDSLQRVDAAVLALDGTPNAAANLLGASQQIQVTINQATLTVRASRDLSAAKSLMLRRTTDNLAAQTKTTVNDLVARKPILDQLGVSTVALQSLQKQQMASMSLSEALAAKVPKVGQKEAAADMATLQSIFTQAIAAYSVPAAVPAPGAAVPPPIAPVPAPPAMMAPPAGRKDRKKKKKEAKANRHDVDVLTEGHMTEA